MQMTLKHFSDCLFHFCSTCADCFTTGWNTVEHFGQSVWAQCKTSAIETEFQQVADIKTTLIKRHLLVPDTKYI